MAVHHIAVGERIAGDEGPCRDLRPLFYHVRAGRADQNHVCCDGTDPKEQMKQMLEDLAGSVRLRGGLRGGV